MTEKTLDQIPVSMFACQCIDDLEKIRTDHMMSVLYLSAITMAPALACHFKRLLYLA